MDRKSLGFGIALAIFACLIQTRYFDMLRDYLTGYDVIYDLLVFGVALGINIALVVVVVVAVLRIVFNIKNRLRNELKRYVKQAINREDLEAVDVRQVLTDIRSDLGEGDIHYAFLGKYIACFVTVIIGFSGIYKMLYSMDSSGFYFREPATGTFDSFVNFIYFSLVTIATLGYGDISPVNWNAKIAVMFEIIVGVVFLVIMINIYFFSADMSEVGNQVVADARAMLEEEETHEGMRRRKLGKGIGGPEELPREEE